MLDHVLHSHHLIFPSYKSHDINKSSLSLSPLLNIKLFFFDFLTVLILYIKGFGFVYFLSYIDSSGLKMERDFMGLAVKQEMLDEPIDAGN